MSIIVKLQQEEIDALTHQDASQVSDEAIQSLLQRLQSQLDGETEELSLSDEDVQAIRNYASDNSDGELDDSVRRLFERVLEQKVDA